VNNWKLVELGLQSTQSTIDYLKQNIIMANPIRLFGDCALKGPFFLCINTYALKLWRNKNKLVLMEFLDLI